MKKESRISGWHAVLEEQYNQEIDGIRDDKGVANAYQRVTGDAKVKALQEGLRMQREVTQLVGKDSGEEGGGGANAKGKAGRIEL